MECQVSAPLWTVAYVGSTAGLTPCYSDTVLVKTAVSCLIYVWEAVLIIANLREGSFSGCAFEFRWFVGPLPPAFQPRQETCKRAACYCELQSDDSLLKGASSGLAHLC